MKSQTNKTATIIAMVLAFPFAIWIAGLDNHPAPVVSEAKTELPYPAPEIITIPNENPWRTETIMFCLKQARAQSLTGRIEWFEDQDQISYRWKTVVKTGRTETINGSRLFTIKCVMGENGPEVNDFVWY